MHFAHVPSFVPSPLTRSHIDANYAELCPGGPALGGYSVCSPGKVPPGERLPRDLDVILVCLPEKVPPGEWLPRHQDVILVCLPEKVPPGERLPRDLDVVVQMLHILFNKPTAQRSGCLNKIVR